MILAANRPCADTSCDSHSRRFEPNWDRFSHYPASVLGAFFDVHEDGRLDVFLLHQNPDNTKQYIMSAITDTQEYDAMFLKVTPPALFSNSELFCEILSK